MLDNVFKNQSTLSLSLSPYLREISNSLFSEISQVKNEAGYSYYVLLMHIASLILTVYTYWHFYRC
jgi:hypothetical protein